MYLIIDLDGTICNSTNRIAALCNELGINAEDDIDKHWTSEQMQDFLSTKKLMEDDLMPKAHKLSEWKEKFGFKVVFLTGRNEYARTGTRKWLTNKLGRWTNSCELLMRPSMERGNPVERVKEKLFLQWSKFKQGQYVFFEDHKKTADIYSQYGIVFQSPQCWDSIL